MPSISPLLRLHWAAGARVALRANAIVGGSVVFAYGVMAPAPDPLGTLRQTIFSVVAAGHPPAQRGLLAAFTIALAATGAPRIALGASGWMRSLPVDAATQRRAAILALSLSQALAMVFAIAGVLTAVKYGVPLSPAKLAGIPLLLAASSLAVLHVRHWYGRTLAMIAIVLAVEGTWMALIAGVIAFVVGDLVAGELTGHRRRAARAEQRGRVPRSPIVAWARISARTLPSSSFAGAFVLPLIFVGFVYLIVRNNTDLLMSTVSRSARIAGVLALAAFTTSVANTLLRARQPWTWARSLPWSSMQRVLSDAMLIGVPLLIVPLAIAPLSLSAAGTIALLVPPTAACSASALRVAANRQTGAAGEAVTFVILAGILATLWPLTSIAACVLTPVFLRLGAERERRFVATRWVELQHDAAGDPTWMGAA